MYPDFYIYQQILTSDGNLFPDESLHPDGFGLIMHPALLSRNGGAEIFFSNLLQLLRSAGKGIPQRFRHELTALCRGNMPAGRNLARPFLNSSCAGGRERFYNHLTGYCLEGYDRWIGGLLRRGCGREMRAYYQSRITDTLFHLIHFPVEHPGARMQDLMVAYKVKAALCILVHRLYTRRDGPGLNSPPPFDAGMTLQNLLQAGSLGEAGCSGILQVFNAAIRRELSSPPSPGIPEEVKEPASPQWGIPESGNLLYEKLIKNMQTELGDIRQLVEMLGTNERQQAGKHRQDWARRVDSTQAMAMLAVGKRTMQRLRNNGQLPFKKTGRKCTYLEADVLKLIVPDKKETDKQPFHGRQSTHT